MKDLVQRVYKGYEYWIKDGWGHLRAGIKIPESIQNYCGEIKLSPEIWFHLSPENNKEYLHIDYLPFWWSPNPIEELRVCCEKIIDKLIELEPKTKED